MSLLVSTRDPEQSARGYSDVVLEGLAPDGGLYVPDECIPFSESDFRRFQNLGYVSLAAVVKLRFTDNEFTPLLVQDIMEHSYSPANFPEAKYGVVTPVRELGHKIYALNLSQGPTAAFKDIALQPLGLEMQHCLEERDETLRVLGATSGDTGSAAEAAIRRLDRIKVFMLSPQVGMSEFQRAQMGQLTDNNVVNISVDGNFDHCQDLVKKLMKDPEFAKLGAVNSINWSRISSQIAYYISGYNQVAEEFGDDVDFVVPSGNFGNILAGYLARKMGLPIRRLIAATNENSVLDELIQTGNYRKREAEITTSPSMDISKASNYERVAFDIFGEDPNELARYMEQFETTGQVRFSDFGVSNSVLKDELRFDSGISTHADRIASIRWAFNQRGTYIDPHTADAVTVARRFRLADTRDETPIICLETALPVKFEPTIEEALGRVPKRQTRFEGLEEKLPKDAFISIKPDAEILKQIIRERSE